MCKYRQKFSGQVQLIFGFVQNQAGAIWNDVQNQVMFYQMIARTKMSQYKCYLIYTNVGSIWLSITIAP